MTLLEVALGAAGALVAGTVQKHATKIPNQAIPFLNGLLGFGAGMIASSGNVEASLAFGVASTVGGTGAHQMAKIGTRALTEVLAKKMPWLTTVNVKIGPGTKLSI